MTEVELEIMATSASSSLEQTLETVTNRIAPTWPLDQSIAVNPYWGFRDQSVEQAAQQLRQLSGSPMLMPHKFYREQYECGALRKEHLEAVLKAKQGVSVAELIAHMHAPEAAFARLPLITDLVDQQRDRLHGMSLHDFVTHNVSQHCASYFDRLQARWRPTQKIGLYPDWLRHAGQDYSPRLLMGLKGLRRQARALPSEPIEAIRTVLEHMQFPEACRDGYLTALLLSVNGWASWCANQRWQAKLNGRDDDSVVHLLAIRLVWEWLLLNGEYAERIDADWYKAWESGSSVSAQAKQDRLDWLLQAALERAYQQPLCEQFACSRETEIAYSSRPALQAVFCIDVRSEVFRRALEANRPGIQTLGFAGFFGLPVSYTPLGTDMSRPQLPGLLAPSLCVTEQSDSKQRDELLVRRRRQRLKISQLWKSLAGSAASTFSFVESCGLAYAGKLWKASLPMDAPLHKAEDAGLTRTERSALRPHILNQSLQQQCDLAASVLRSMSLARNFARIVLLTGHGSQSINNAQASGLDCGACCGQTGEVNARALAGLLNQAAVRASLLERGIAIPQDTWFVAALHNTTTDEVELFDTDQAPFTHAADLAQLRSWLAAAGDRARSERAASLGVLSPSPVALKKALRVRANDWSQVRPEWGLADNACFIIARRSRTRHLDLKGRAFLHEYDAACDPQFSVLESIMTAPMLVTNWINMQYYASTVDNVTYGSGNKVLHNVVGGRLGLFEGNGGDLRIGLSMQSLQDGKQLRHTPLRLSVFIEAPQATIAAIVERNEVVKDLVTNGWLYLFQLEPYRPLVCQYCQEEGKREEASGGWAWRETQSHP